MNMLFKRNNKKEEIQDFHKEVLDAVYEVIMDIVERDYNSTYDTAVMMHRDCFSELMKAGELVSCDTSFFFRDTDFKVKINNHLLSEDKDLYSFYGLTSEMDVASPDRAISVPHDMRTKYLIESLAGSLKPIRPEYK